MKREPKLIHCAGPGCAKTTEPLPQPEGWITTLQEQVYRFFCSLKCLDRWLKQQVSPESPSKPDAPQDIPAC